MTLPLFHTDNPLGDARVGQEFQFTGAAVHHAITVRRMKPGESLELTDGSGLRVRGELTFASKDSATLLIDEVELESAPSPRLGLIQALAKGDRDLAAVEMAVEVGVDTVIPWQAQRSIVQWRGTKAHKAHAKWENQVQAASLQSRRARFPDVRELTGASAICELAKGGALVIVLHETGSQPFVPTLRAEVQARSPQEIFVVVGPEGGITDAEREQFEGAGAVTAVLGPTVMRASTAGPAALALTQQELGRWG